MQPETAAYTNLGSPLHTPQRSSFADRYALRLPHPNHEMT